MTEDQPHGVALHHQHLALLRSIVESQQQLIDVLESMTENSPSEESNEDDDDDDGVTYRTLAEKRAEERAHDDSI